VFCICEKDLRESIGEIMQKEFERNGLESEIIITTTSNTGTTEVRR
jgi:hypothetical protein